MQKVVLAATVAAVFAAGFGAAKLDSRSKLAAASVARICSDVPCDHFNVRVAVIESVIGQGLAQPRYLAIGDSLTEMADLPSLCGAKPINAGIGWATTATFKTLARDLAEKADPRFVLLSLGTNDILQGRRDGLETRIADIAAGLSRWPVFIDRPAANLARLPDGIHLSPIGYKDWIATIERAVNCPMARSEP